MVYCDKCGKKVPEKSAYCPECGFKLFKEKHGSFTSNTIIASTWVIGVGIIIKLVLEVSKKSFIEDCTKWGIAQMYNMGFYELLPIFIYSLTVPIIQFIILRKRLRLRTNITTSTTLFILLNIFGLATILYF